MSDTDPSPVPKAATQDASAPPVVRKYKASELPLTSAQRTTFDELAHTFKKKGGYDAIRKQVWEKLASVRPLARPLSSLLFPPAH